MELVGCLHLTLLLLLVHVNIKYINVIKNMPHLSNKAHYIREQHELLNTLFFVVVLLSQNIYSIINQIM